MQDYITPQADISKKADFYKLKIIDTPYINHLLCIRYIYRAVKVYDNMGCLFDIELYYLPK